MFTSYLLKIHLCFNNKVQFFKECGNPHQIPQNSAIKSQIPPNSAPTLFTAKKRKFRSNAEIPYNLATLLATSLMH